MIEKRAIHDVVEEDVGAAVPRGRGQGANDGVSSEGRP